MLAVVLEKITLTQADKYQTNFELCQCFDSEGLSTARVLRLLHVLKVYLLNIDDDCCMGILLKIAKMNDPKIGKIFSVMINLVS